MTKISIFCFCCLGTDGLQSLFGSPTEENCAKMIEDLFSIQFSQEYEGQSYVCEECKAMLLAIVNFNQQFANTLDILKGSSLISIQEVNNIRVINKVAKYSNTSDEEKFEDLEVIFMIEPDAESENSTDLPQIESSSKEKQKNSRRSLKRRQRPSKQSEPSYEVPEDLKCSVCSETQLNAHTYHVHMNEHFPNHVCEVCGKGFLTEKRLKRHMPSHDNGPFKCNACDAVFTKYNTMNSHRQRKHSLVEQYACPYCAQRFPTFSRRAAHLARAHGRAAPRACPLCEKTFALSGNLSTHIRNTHLRVKRHFCTQCDAAFFMKSDLRGHVASHTGVKEFRCHMCSKSYPRKNALSVHMRMHSGEKRFSCQQCDKKFTQKCALVRHGAIHARRAKDGEAAC